MDPEQGGVLEFHSQTPHAKLFAIEASLEAKKSLSKKMPSLSFPVETADDLEKVNEYYDVITLFQTLEHVYDPQKLCKDVYNKLHPQGICIITVPNRYSYDILLGGINKGFCFTNPTHLQFFYQTSYA
ncbi:MAG: methyltransferase domain-containing protein [Candidatus Omnitrophota bacterium]